MRTWKKMIGILPGLCVLFAIGFSGIASAQNVGATRYWKIGTLAPDGVGWARHIKELVLPTIEKVTDGELSIKVYWGGIMGDDEDYIEKMHSGILDGAGMSGQGVAFAIPEMVVLELPFLFDSYEEVDFIKSRMYSVFEDYAEKQGFFLMAWIDQDFDQVYSTRLPMDRLEHFAQSKIHTWYGPLEMEVLKSLGADPIPIEVPDAPAAYRQGITDSSITPAMWILGTQLYSVIRYINPVKIRYSPAVIIVNLSNWNTLEQKYQKTFLERRDELIGQFCDGIRSDNERALEAMYEYGLKKVEMSEQDLQTMRYRAMKSWNKLSDNLYPKTLLDELLGNLAEKRKNAS